MSSFTYFLVFSMVPHPQVCLVSMFREPFVHTFQRISLLHLPGLGRQWREMVVFKSPFKRCLTDAVFSLTFTPFYPEAPVLLVPEPWVGVVVEFKLGFFSALTNTNFGFSFLNQWLPSHLLSAFQHSAALVSLSIPLKSPLALILEGFREVGVNTCFLCHL